MNQQHAQHEHAGSEQVANQAESVAPDVASANNAPSIASAPLLSGSALHKRYRVAPQRLFQRAIGTDALHHVDFSLQQGQSLALVGESGSGKTTLLKVLLGLTRASAGEVRFDGKVVDPTHDQLLWLRRRTGVVFQDPYSSFNPRRTVGQTVAEPLVAIQAEGDHHDIVTAMLARMELPANSALRYPHEFSGGQRQRIALARALVHGPDVLVADEPVSALDVLVRGRILRLLSELRAELGLTLLTVTHDLGIVPALAERVAVMRQGRMIESGSVSQIFSQPEQPYTQRLLAALPRLPD